MAFDPYRILGVDQHADQKAIREAYKRLAQINHPDKNPDDPHSVQRFKQIQQAYEILSDGDRRARLDKGEDPKAFNMEQAARALIIEVLYKCLQTRGIEHLIRNMKNTLGSRIRESNGILANAESICTDLRKAKAKFKYNGTQTNVIEMALDNEYDRVKLEVENAKQGLKAATLAQKTLDEYEDVDDLIKTYDYLPYTTHTVTGIE